jgi:hypothetical protein
VPRERAARSQARIVSQREVRESRTRTAEGRTRAIHRAISPQKHENNSFIKMMGDLPCKRTCHGKGRMTDNKQDLSASWPFGPDICILYIILINKTHSPTPYLLPSLLNQSTNHCSGYMIKQRRFCNCLSLHLQMISRVIFCLHTDGIYPLKIKPIETDLRCIYKTTSNE